MSQSRNDREWVIMRDEFETEEDFRRAVTEELAGLENMGHRGGGGFVTTPLRHGYQAEMRTVDDRPLLGLPEMEYVTLGWHFKLVFMPAARRAVEPESLEPEPVPDPVSAAEPAVATT
jgi:hypothetical protein